MVRKAWVWSRVWAVILPSSRPPEPVTSLNVEPGGNWSLTAKLCSGRAGVLEQLLVVGVADALREEVVVVGGQRDHGQDLARLRVHDDEHAALEAGQVHGPLERLLGDALRLHVDGQLQRVALLRLLHRADHAHHAALGVLLDLLAAVRAAQLLLEGLLHAGLADQVVVEVALVLEVGVLVVEIGPVKPSRCETSGP